jgi:hypothetical protein
MLSGHFQNSEVLTFGGKISIYLFVRRISEAQAGLNMAHFVEG